MTFLGVLILIYGFYEAKKLRDTLGEGSLKEAWDLLSVFIALFIVGYIAFLVILVSETVYVPPEMLTAVVFFLGSVFVAMTAYYNRKAFTGI